MAVPLAEPAPVAVGAPRAVPALTAALAAAAAAACLGADRLVPATTPAPSVALVAGLFAALVVAGTLNLEYSYRGNRDAFDHFEAAVVPAIFFLPPVTAVAVAAGAKAVCQVVRRVSPRKGAFNTAQWAAATAAGALVLAGLRGDETLSALAALAVASVAVVAVNAGAVAAVLALVQPGERSSSRLRALLASTAATGAINICFGILFVTLLLAAPAVAPLLLVPLLLLHWASHGEAAGRAEQARTTTMRAATSALALGPDQERALDAFLEAVGVGFDRDRVELVTLEPRGAVRRVWRRGAGRTTTTPAGAALTEAVRTFQRPMRLDAGGGRLGELLRSEGARDCLAAPFRSAGGGGVLVLHGARSPVTLPDRELALLAELAREVGTSRDRAAVLRGLLDERAELARIVNDSCDGILTVTPDGTVSTWNRAFARLTGYAADTATGPLAIGLLDPVDASGSPVELGGWAAPGAVLPRDLLVRTRSGRRRWLSCSYARSSGDDGRPDRLIVTARDVTALEQRQVVLALQATALELIAAGRPPAQTLQSLADHLAVLGDGGSAVLLTSDADPTGLEPVAMAGVELATLRDLGALDGDGWAARTVASVAAVVVDDVQADPASPAQVRAAARAHGVRSYATVPVRSTRDDRVLGVLLVLGSTPGPSPQQDGEALESAAHLAALAVERGEIEPRPVARRPVR